jgi:tetratricopeptide (TPR) repeat protein
VRALGDSGQCAAAAAAGRELISGAEKVAYLPLLAESLNAAASRSGTECLRPEEMLAMNRRAAMAGLASHDDEAAAEGAILVAQIAGDRMSRVGEGRVWIDLADAILRGMSHPPWTLESWYLKALALVREQEGDVAGALEACQRDRALIEKNQGAENLEYAIVINNIGVILAAQSRFAEALPYYRQAEQITVRSSGQHVFAGLTLVNQAEVLNGLARYQEAHTAAERALDVFRRGSSAPFYQAVAFTKRSEAFTGSGRPTEAEADAEEAVRLFGDDRSLYPCEARFVLARLLWSRPETRARALTLARDARDGYQRLSDGKPKAAEVATWLAARDDRSRR